MAEWTSVEEVRRAERQIVDSVFGAARRLLSVTEPYQAELCGSVILEMWHRGTFAGADPDEVEDWRRMPSAMLPRVVRDLAVSVIPAIESDGSARALATLAALGSVAATPLGDAARAGAERLGRRGCGAPRWTLEVGRAMATGAVRGVSGDADVVLIGFDYPSGAAHCLFVAAEDGTLADALLVEGNLDDAASAVMDARRFSVNSVGVGEGLRRVREALVRRDRAELAAGALFDRTVLSDDQVDLALRPLVYARCALSDPGG